MDNQSSSLVYFVKMGETYHDSGDKANMRIFFSQSGHTYCRIPARDSKWQGKQCFHGNEKFVKRMDIIQANISETDVGFSTSGYGSACIQVVPPDLKVHKLATRSTRMDGGCVSNKLDTPKSICFPTFC